MSVEVRTGGGGDGLQKGKPRAPAQGRGDLGINRQPRRHGSVFRGTAGGEAILFGTSPDDDSDSSLAQSDASNAKLHASTGDSPSAYRLSSFPALTSGHRVLEHAEHFQTGRLHPYGLIVRLGLNGKCYLIPDAAGKVLSNSARVVHDVVSSVAE